MTSTASNLKTTQPYHKAGSPAPSTKSRKSISRTNNSQTQQTLAKVSQLKHHDTSESSGEEYLGNIQNDEQEINDSDLEKEPEEEPELPPVKPVIPTHQWECEHCTYVNRAGTRVCAICCKTPTRLPQKPSTDSQHRRRLRQKNSDISGITNSFDTQTRSQKNTSSGTSFRRSSIKSTNSRSDTDYNDTRTSRQRRHSEFTAMQQPQPMSDDYSDIPLDEGYVAAKFNKLRITQKASKAVEAEEDPYEGVQMRSSDVDSTKSNRKGRPSRKISFWPGTKFSQKC
jgi:E3 ubiquitin-protein ligase RNF31